MHPHGHGRTAYDYFLCCLCQPQDHQHQLNDKGTECTVCHKTTAQINDEKVNGPS